MLKRALTALLAVAFVFLIRMGTPSVVLAQDSVFSPGRDSALSDSYRAAIQNCGTPSLECLVHHVYKYIQIEITNSPHVDTPGSAGAGIEKNTTVAGGLMYLIGKMYATPVASTNTYVADVLENANIATPAYAQGLGFAALDPVLALWKTFRNIAYLFFVVIFIVIGFLIMFRHKVNGADITAQQAIPSIIISLIFVTFSYAIAGFMIDLMYLIMFLMVGLFDSSLADANIIDFNIFQIGGLLFGTVWGSFNQNVDLITNLLAGLIQSNGISQAFGFVGGLTLSVILTVAVIFGVFKLFFELLKSYASIVISTVLSPIYLMMGAIPGNNAFVPWAKNIAGNLAAFPTVLFIVILYNQFTKLGNATTGGFMPPFLVGRGQSGAIASLMGLALILAMPEIVKEVKTKIGATDGFGTKVAGWAGKRAGTGADLSIPVMSSTGYGGLQAGIGAAAAFKSKDSRTLKGVWDGAKYGVPQYDKNEKYIGQRGGALGKQGGLIRGWNTGQKARKKIDDFTDGRLFEPDNYRQLLENLGEKKNPEKEKPVNPPLPGLG